MPSQEEIDAQQELLRTYRRTLHFYVTQLAELGHQHAPPGLLNGIHECRHHIQRIKTHLRQFGVVVEDLPDDADVPTDHRTYNTIAHSSDHASSGRLDRVPAWIHNRTFLLGTTLGALLLLVSVVLMVRPFRPGPAASTPTLSGTVGARTDPPLAPTRASRTPNATPTSGVPSAPCFTITARSKILALAFSPDGKLLMLIPIIYNIDTRRFAAWGTERPLEGHSDNANHVAWSPNSQRLASAAYDNTVRVWDVTIGMELSPRQTLSTGDGRLDWSPDGKRLAASEENKILIWKAAVFDPNATPPTQIVAATQADGEPTGCSGIGR